MTTNNRAEYFRKYRVENREKRNEYNRVWRASDPDRVAKRIEYDRARNADPKVKARKAEMDLTRKADPKVRAKRAAQYQSRKANPEKMTRIVELHRFRKYGLLPGQFDTMFANQEFVCGNAGCKSTAPGHNQGWCVDHCHTTGEVRGILCNPCNVALGLVRDSEQKLLGLVEYLRTHKAIEQALMNLERLTQCECA